ncbi:hypothetical protein MIZ03_0532 [Rhodoferax lithotrophicus]|uniref:Uncharacterized protein n=1 Tax=Rhodoferax lithotrophicus TaxID=2798804 RepID=A0ABN6D232_9BURK|nr:hypothetical protein MIZ03_0532 [Rhodoferax sp. MIZ03]
MLDPGVNPIRHVNWHGPSWPSLDYTAYWNTRFGTGRSKWRHSSVFGYFGEFLLIGMERQGQRAHPCIYPMYQH